MYIAYGVVCLWQSRKIFTSFLAESSENVLWFHFGKVEMAVQFAKQRRILLQNFETEPEEADNLEHMVLQMQWIAIAYAAIRQSLFLKWCLDADGIPAEEALDYETVREYMVVISRMTGYEDEDIREYLENSFAELIWDWGYFALII